MYHKRIDIYKKPLVSNRCKLHSESLKLYCKECDCLICILCRDYGNHKGHHIELITSVIEQYHSEIQENIRNIQNLVNRFEGSIKQMNDHIRTLRENCLKKEKEIDVHMDKTIGLINQKREELKKKARELIAQDEREINQDRQKLALSFSEVLVLMIRTKSLLYEQKEFSWTNLQSFAIKLSEFSSQNEHILKKKITVDDGHIHTKYDIKKFKLDYQIGPIERTRRKQNEDPRVIVGLSLSSDSDSDLMLEESLS